MHIKTSLDLTCILFKSYLCLTWHILLVSYSNLISVLLDTLGTLCTSKLALILLVSYSNLISVLLQIIVLFSPFSAKVRKCPPLQAGPRFLKSARLASFAEVDHSQFPVPRTAAAGTEDTLNLKCTSSALIFEYYLQNVCRYEIRIDVGICSLGHHHLPCSRWVI